MSTQVQARPVSNGRPVQSQQSELEKLKAENAALKAAAEAAAAVGPITAVPNGDYKGTPMVLIDGFGGRPINSSYKKAARIGFAVVSGALSSLPEFVDAWNALVDEHGDPSAS